MVVAKGVDYSFGRPNPVGLKAAGYAFVVRYLSGGNSSKDVTKSEIVGLRAAGLSFALVWEQGGEAARGGFPAGVVAGKAAQTQLAALGLTGPRPVVYAAVDYDPQGTDIATAVEYVRGFAKVLGPRAGVYGSEKVLTAVYAAVHDCHWYWHTYAWGNPPAFAQLRQVKNGVSVAGATVDLCEAWAPDYGQTPIYVPPTTGAPVEHTVAATLARCAAEAAHQTQDWTDLCDHFSGIAWGLPHSGSLTAREHWLAIPANRKHPGDHNAPDGALKFYGVTSQGQGHVTIAKSGGEYTTDRIKAGAVAWAPPGTDFWGLPYLGWADPVFPGAGADFGHLSAAKPPAPTPAPAPGPRPPVPHPVPSYPGPFGGDAGVAAHHHGTWVCAIQKGLHVAVTGTWDQPTNAAMKVWQKRRLIRPTGAVGPIQYKVLARPF